MRARSASCIGSVHPLLRVAPNKMVRNIVGGVVSPLLANIHLDRLDKFVEGTLIPEFTRGEGQEDEPGYTTDCSYRIQETRKEGRLLPKPSRAPPQELRTLAPRAIRSTRTTDGCNISVCGRLPAWLRRTEGRSRGDQGPTGDVPARSPQAGAFTREDLDHPCPTKCPSSSDTRSRGTDHPGRRATGRSC